MFDSIQKVSAGMFLNLLKAALVYLEFLLGTSVGDMDVSPFEFLSPSFSLDLFFILSSLSISLSLYLF